MAAILRRGSGPSLRRLERGEVWETGCRRVCRAYPASKIEPRFRSEVIANPLPIGMRVAVDSSSCLIRTVSKILMIAFNRWIKDRVWVRSNEDVSHHWKAERDPHLEFVWYRHP